MLVMTIYKYACYDHYMDMLVMTIYRYACYYHIYIWAIPASLAFHLFASFYNLSDGSFYNR